MYALFVILFLTNILEAQVIVVYGASCSGKSTLSALIAKEFGAPWRVIDRDDVIDAKQDEEHADEYVIEELEQALKNGEHIIIDTQDPAGLTKSIAQHDPLMVFVYSTMPTLIKRDLQRSQNRNRSPKRAFDARSWVYDTFARLLSLDGETLIDTIESKDIPSDILDFYLTDHSKAIFTALLQTKSVVYAKNDCDVIIKSDKYSFSESVEQIRNRYESRKNSRIICQR